MLLDAIHHLRDDCKRLNKCLPDTIIVQSDNTSSQAKNKWGNLCISLSTAKLMARSSDINYSQVGHTQEYIDQVSATMHKVVATKSKSNCPDELVNRLQHQFVPIIKGHHGGGGCACPVQRLEALVGIKAWISNLRTTLDHGFIRRKEDATPVPRSLTFKHCCDFTPEQSKMIAPQSRVIEDRLDTFMLVRRYMSDVKLSQQPTLAIPRSRALCVPNKPMSMMPPQPITSQ